MTHANDTETTGDDRVAAPTGRKLSMAQQQSNGGRGAGESKYAGAASATADHSSAKGTADKSSAKGAGGSAKPKQNGHKEWFGRFAHETARLSGKPGAFILAAGAVVVWAVTGPLFNYSDTWQLVINTSTTIITFLMVFLIQNTQNRDTLALQVKLSELIIAVHGAKNKLAAAEDLSEEELEQLHKDYCSRADTLRETLAQRRATTKKSKGSTHQS
jgi:low affinity Fe/Cu permease